jgi:DNA (cytosine-5)-methyltransferase 1
MKPIELLIIDLFCGAGGVTTAFEYTEGCKVIACINHDEIAIQSHKQNHPESIHLLEDVRKVKMVELKFIVNQYKAIYPNAKLLIHASLECTNFSKAKGGKPRDADSRSLAEDMPRYCEALNPDFFSIENVVEFMAYGPLDENGKPVSKHAGESYLNWVAQMRKLNHGYNYTYNILTAADFGAYTTRKRFFAVFSKPELHFEWPQPTHTKNVAKNPNLKPYKAVRKVLDLSDKGESIFTRKKSLVDNSLERIYWGLVKFCSQKQFIQKYYSGKPKQKVQSINEPIGAVTTIDHHSLVSAEYLIQYNGKPGEAEFDLNRPIGTIATKDRFALIQPQFITRDFTNGGNLNSIDGPVGSLTTVPKINLVSAETAFIINPQWGVNNSQNLNKPCFTLIARMDKAPPILVQLETGELAIKVLPTDSPMMVKIKEFMAANGIYDIKTRMLRIPELLAIQGFPKNYKLAGTETLQKKFIGNSVENSVMKAIAYQLLSSTKIQKAA